MHRRRTYRYDNVGNIVGTTRWRLTVLEQHVRVAMGGTGKHFNRGVRCRCSCGKECVLTNAEFFRDLKKSCGCAMHTRKHGAIKTVEYKAWQALKDRCLNPSCKFYSYYGGRGITVCDRWRDSFEAFLSDMGKRPPGLSIDRRDNDGPYSPDNCRWATREEQQSNRRTTRFLEWNGHRRSVSEWAALFGVRRERITELVRDRPYCGLSIPEIAIRLGVELI